MEWHLTTASDWRVYSQLPQPDRIEMLVPSGLEDDPEEGVEYFCQGMETGACFPLALHCIDCGKVRHFEVSPQKDSLPDMDETMYQLAGLDNRLRPWIAEHLLCQYAIPLPGFEVLR